MPSLSSPALLRGLAAAGALVVIAGGGLLFAHTQSSSENGAGSSSGSAGAGAPGHQAEKRAASPGYGVEGSAAASGPVSLSYHLKGKIATARALTSDDNYTRSNLAPKVHKALASVPPISKSAGAGGTTAQRAEPSATIGGIRVLKLAGCLSGLADGRTIVIADVARFLGRPATIVVLKSQTGARLLDVVVVRTSCSLASPQIIARLTVPAS